MKKYFSLKKNRLFFTVLLMSYSVTAGAQYGKSIVGGAAQCPATSIAKKLESVDLSSVEYLISGELEDDEIDKTSSVDFPEELPFPGDIDMDDSKDGGWDSISLGEGTEDYNDVDQFVKDEIANAKIIGQKVYVTQPQRESEDASTLALISKPDCSGSLFFATAHDGGYLMDIKYLDVQKNEDGKTVFYLVGASKDLMRRLHLNNYVIE
jgi:hypothetical protein